MNKRESQDRVDAIRRSVKAKELIDALTDCALGVAEMDSNRIQAARILLGKSVPDLKSVDHSGDVNNHITIDWNK